MRVLRWLVWSSLACVALHAPAWAEKPLSDTPFEASPRQLLNLAAERPASAKVSYEYLLDEVVWTIDAQGRVTERRRYVMRVMGQAAVDMLRSASQAWAPWHENKPDIQVRVIQPDGTDRTLDPALFTEAGVRTGAGAVFSDARVLKGPLPPATVGSVVEQVFTLSEHKPFLEAGRVFRYALGNGAIPTRHTRLVIDAPEAMSIQWRSHGLEVRPEVQKRAGRQRLTFQYADVPVVDQYEQDLPLDVHPGPTFEFSTAPSWGALASAYASLLQGPMASMNVTDRAAKIREKVGPDRDALIAAMYREAQKIPYTSIAFGEGAIVPVAPAEIERRGFADCKDKALLLVGLLRAVGVEADLALVRAGGGTDVHRDLPGLDLFDHAIVKVRDGLWLDPTSEFTPYGQVPWALSGRQALVIRPDTTTLSPIPTGTPDQNTSVRTVDLYFGHPTGRVTVMERTTGGFADGDRSYWRDLTETQRFDAVKPLAEAWSGKLAGPPTLSDVADLDVPLTSTVQVQGAEDLMVVLGDQSLTLDVGSVATDLLGFLPAEDREEGTQKTAEQERAERAERADRTVVPVRKRTLDMRLPPYTRELVYRLHAPPGYQVVQTPDDNLVEAPGLRLLVSTSREPGQPVTVRIKLQISGTRLTPAQAVAWFATVDRWLKSDALQVTVAPTAMNAMKEGRFSYAIQQARADADAWPDDPWVQVLYAHALYQAGLADRMFDGLKRAVALSPDDPFLLNEAATLDLHDRYGDLGSYMRRPRHPDDTLGWLRRACGVTTRFDHSCVNLANALAVTERGAYTRVPAERQEAIQVLADRRRRFGPGPSDLLWYDLLVLEGRWADLETAAAGAGADQGGPDRYQVLALAGRKGVPAALAELRRRFPDPKAQGEALSFVAGKFSELRRYDMAAAFLEQSAAISAEPLPVRERARVLASARRWEDVKLPANDPVRVYLDFIDAARTGDPSQVLHPAVRPKPGDGEAQSLATFSATQVDIAMDMLASAQWSREGNARLGWKLIAPPHFNGLEVFVAPHEGDLHLVAGGGVADPLATYALSRLPDDVEGARQWAVWAYTAPGVHVCEVLAPEGLQGADAATIGLFSACVAAEARPSLAEATLKNSSVQEPAKQEAWAGARLEAARQEQAWDRWLKIYDETPPTALVRTHFATNRGWVLYFMGRYQEAAAQCGDVLRVKPGHIPAVECQARAYRRMGDLAAMQATFRAGIAANPKNVASIYNNSAWLAEPGDPRALEDARAAANITKYQDEDVLHTLAAVLLDHQRPDEAFEALRQAIKIRPDPYKPLGDHWDYVQGRLAEVWGLPDVAVSLYRAVKPLEGPGNDTDSSYHRAQERLRALGAPAAAPAEKPAASGTRKR